MLSPRLLRAQAGSADELLEAVSDWVEQGVHFVLTDLATDALLRLADGLADRPVLLLNVSAPDDVLRGVECRPNVAHVHPSRAMLTDALVHYLVAKNWTRVLLLEGAAETDAAMAEAMRRSAAKFGAEIVAERPFALTNDPRRRV